MGADQIERIEFIGVAVDDDPLVDENCCGSNRIVRRCAGLEGRRLFIGRVRKDEPDRLKEGHERCDDEGTPAKQREEASPRHLASVLDESPSADHGCTLGKPVLRVEEGNYYRAIVAANRMRIGRFCVDWKVVAGLAAVAVGVFLVQPRLFISALPVLLVAACPLSMVLMMWGMRSMGQSAPPLIAPPLMADRQLNPHEQIARLRSQLTELQSPQAGITDQIRSLEAALDVPGPNAGELAPQRPS